MRYDAAVRPGRRALRCARCSRSWRLAILPETAEGQLSPEVVLAEMTKNGITHVVWLPDSETNFLYQLMQAEPSLRLVPVSREGLAFSIAAGLSAPDADHPDPEHGVDEIRRLAPGLDDRAERARDERDVVSGLGRESQSGRLRHDLRRCRRVDRRSRRCSAPIVSES